MAYNFDRMVNGLKGFTLNQYLDDWIFYNQVFITDLNKKRLIEKGTDVDGNEIRTFKAEQGENYAGFTITARENDGLQADHVDFKVTGKFHSTFETVNRSNSFSIDADDDKPGGKISDNVDVESALGLADLRPLQAKLLPDLRKEVLSLIQGS